MTFDAERIHRLLNIFNRQTVRKADLEDVASSFICEIFQLLAAKQCEMDSVIDDAVKKHGATLGFKGEEGHVMPDDNITYQSSGLENRPKMKEKDDV